MNDHTSHSSPLDELPDDLRRAVSEAIARPVDTAAESRALERARRVASADLEPKSVPASCTGRNLNLPDRPRTKSFPLRWTAAAAAALLAALTLLALPGGNAGRAFAQVQQAIAELSAVSYRVRPAGDEASATRVLLWEASKGRVEFSDGRYLVFDSLQGESVVVDPAARSAIRFQGIAREPESSLLEMLRSVKAGTVESVAPKEIDGRACPGYLVHDGQRTIRLWVAPESMLPVYAETEPADTPEGQPVLRFDRFAFNVAVTPSELEVTVPEGYAVTERTVPSPLRQRGERLLLVAGQGLGGARFGMSEEAVVNELGEPDAVQPMAHGEGRILRYDSRGFWLEMDGLGKLAGVACHFHRASAAPVARSFYGATGKGIVIGATADEILEAYGIPDGDQNSSRSDKRVLSYFDLGLNFILDDGRLVEISGHEVAPTAEADSSGGC